MIGAAQRKVLIVEHDAQIAATVAAALERLTFWTTIARSPREALDLVSGADHFALIVLDADLAGEPGGVALARHILATISIPIVYLIGPDPSEAYSRLREAGGYGCVERDCGEASLQSAVVVALELFDARRDIDVKAEEHRENDARFRRMFDEAPIGAAIVSLDARYQVANAALCSMLGYSMAELATLSVADVTHPDDLPAIVSFNKRLKDGEIDHFELEKRYYRRDGSLLWTRLNVRLIRDDSGNALYFFPTMEDITERKAQEEALLEKQRSLVASNRMLHLVLETIPVRLFWKDRSLTYLGCNGLFAKDAGCASPADVIGGNDFGMSWRDQAALYQRDDTHVIDSGNAKVGYEEPQTTSTGQTIWLRTTKVPLRDLDNSIVGILGTYEDITERKKADMALRESEEILRSFVDQSGEGIVILERDGTIIQWNRGIESITGISRNEAIGRPIWDVQTRVMTSEARNGLPLEILQRLTRKLLKSGDAELFRRPFDTVIQTVRGESRHIQQVAFPIRSGGSLRIGSVIRDITLQKNAEAELTRAKHVAEESSRMKSVLLSNLSHEFRTPINGILGLADLLLDEQQDPAIRELVEGITTSGRRLHSTLDSILKLALLTSGEVASKAVPVSVERPVRRVIERFRSQAERRGVKLESELGGGGHLVLADEEMLVDILSYLVDNALKFTKRGSVSVAWSSPEESVPGRSSIRVQDTGIGIAAKHMEMIFQEFKQVSEGRSREYEGCGVGLTVARKMTQLLDGDISVSSEVGRGSTFTVWLPAPVAMTIQQHASHDEREISHAKRGPSFPEVLIVEDNFINKAVIEDFLKHMCRTDHARDGSTAIRMAGQKKYAAILMDINLGCAPDGIETTKEIRQLHGYQSTPIVAVTGYSLPGDGDRLISQGLSMYLPKPFDRSEIVDVVRRALGG